MGIEIAIGGVLLSDIIAQGPLILAWYIFINGGWLFFLLFFIYGLYLGWINGRKNQFAKKWQHVLLAIDIPRNNEQTPKAVESIFIALAGAQSNPNYKDRYWTGKVQESFSFEIVSLEGYIQFLVRTPAHFRDLIEAAVATLKEALIEEIIVVALVVLLFLFHVRSATVAIVTIPLSVLIGFMLVKLFGISLNIMSLGGIALAIGDLVDAGIVMTENAYKSLVKEVLKTDE